MKKIRMGLLALAAIAGAGSAFAINHPKPRVGALYYAKLIAPGQSVWTTTQPDADCTRTSALACTITSTSSGVTSLPANTFPAQKTIVHGNGLARVANP
ncbi:hypothetical protein [Mucilaginibacter pedocola]|nr:hypothetical protein [Mucilaginibacter pedocola]